MPGNDNRITINHRIHLVLLPAFRAYYVSGSSRIRFAGIQHCQRGRLCTRAGYRFQKKGIRAAGSAGKVVNAVLTRGKLIVKLPPEPAVVLASIRPLPFSTTVRVGGTERDAIFGLAIITP